ncbi:S41 family peptidase [Sporosarcina sp. FA9]|uniref:S41 family peptidase n=1 Tax=Sporosarcina sp. FA9 TaxID=3413030 RepID=UPI003F65A282
MLKYLQSICFAFAMIIIVQPHVASADSIDEIRELVHTYYVDNVSKDLLNQSTVEEIVSNLDKHSIHMSATEYNTFINTIEQKLIGIGVVLEEDLEGVRILSVVPNGPAERAGIQSGDLITNVNNESLVGKTIQSAVSLISGKEKTSVSLTFFRPSTNKIYIQKLIREEIILENVKSSMLGGNIGYIRLNSFSTESKKELNQAILKLQGANGWIIDIRNNGGGFVNVAQEVTGFFPTLDKAFQLVGKNKESIIFDVIPQENKLNAPIHLLVNEFSASASEMVSAAIKEKNAAVLYGQTTYGKGTMQSMYPLSDGSVLKLTTARFFSPNGQSINEVGISPDVRTEIGEELEVAHYDHLKKSLDGYNKLTTLTNIPVTKEFTVKMNIDIEWNSIEQDGIQLIQLGGEKVEVEFDVINDKSMKIIPKNKLISKGKYLLIIHPEIKDKLGRLMEKGVYLEITVN